MALTVDQITQQYATAEQAANAALARGDSAAAHQQHLTMQSLVDQRNQIASDNDAWHKAHGTGPYAPTGSSTAAAAGQSTAARDGATAWLKSILGQYGLNALAGSVDSLVREWGTNTDVIGMKLKDTDSYKTRFKGLLALQQKGITDISNEAEYIGIESKYRDVFRSAGLQSFLGDAGSQAELDSIAKLAADYSVSVNEVQSRVADAQRVANDTAPEVKDALQRFYGVGPAQLVQYVLDPAKTTEQINRQVNAGLTSGYAARQNLNLDQSVSEQIANISGGNDLNVAGLNGQLKNAADVAMATKRLADIDQTSLTDSEIAQNEFNLSTDASQKIKKLQSSERAKFGGTSSIQTGSLSNNSGF